MKFIFITFVKAYRFFISPVMGATCRFHPTCSAYMIEAVEKHGMVKGLILGIKRILKCHPYHKGHFDDPVPIPTDQSFKLFKAIATKSWFGYKRKKFSLFKYKK